ncbi:hypothetical protein NL676_010956 [Syzygium grande]|nr:hypothetical protein NL676_010956 [Syzygium grande]
MLEKQELGHRTTLRVPNDTAHDLKGEVEGGQLRGGNSGVVVRVEAVELVEEDPTTAAMIMARKRIAEINDNENEEAVASPLVEGLLVHQIHSPSRTSQIPFFTFLSPSFPRKLRSDLKSKSTKKKQYVQ